MADAIDAEVKKFFDQCYQKAKEIIGENKEGLVKLSNILMEREILEGEELDEIWKKLNGADTKS
jgi:cell division protease FtsH